MAHFPERDKISLLRVQKTQGSLSFSELELQVNHAIPEVRKGALSHLIRMGETGVDLVLQALKDTSPIVVWEAYRLLKPQTQQRVKSALAKGNPYRFFKCITILAGKPDQLTSVSLTQLSLKGEDSIVFIGDTTGGVQAFSLPSQRKLSQWQAHLDDVTTLAPLSNHPNQADGFPLLLTGGRDRVVRLWKKNTEPAIATFEGHRDWISSIAVAPCTNGTSPAITRFLTASRDKTIKLWSLQSRFELATLTGHQYAVSSVAFSPDGQSAVSGSLDQTVKVWHLKSRRSLRTLEGHEAAVSAVATAPTLFPVSQDKFIVASGGLDGAIKIWQCNDGILLKSLKGHQEAVTSLAFSPDGLILASGGGDGTVRLWNVSSGKSISILRGHKNWITKVSFSPDGCLLASCSDDGAVRIWGLKLDSKDLPVHLLKPNAALS